VDSPITETLPRRLFRSDEEVARFRTVTARHVLGMSALDAPDPPRSTAPAALALKRRFWSAPDRVALALQQPILPGHGRTYQYNDLTPMLATGLVQYATGKTALEFAEEHLFKPLAFRNHEWMHQDPAGVDNGGYGLRLRPIDMQKFGILYLNGGLWHQRSRVSRDWVARSFQPWNRSAEHLREPNYGWYWWAYDGRRGWTGHMAAGWKGQRIAVFPKQRVVVTMTACIQDGSEHRVFDHLIAHAARALRDDRPAPPDPAGKARLNALLAALRTDLSPDCAGGDVRMIPSVTRKARRLPFRAAAN